MAIDRSGGTATASVDEAALAQLASELIDALDPVAIYLFGSRARGDNRPDSDYDLLILVDAPVESLLHLTQLAYAVTTPFEVGQDLLVWARDEFVRRLAVRTSLPATVLREGHLVYADVGRSTDRRGAGARCLSGDPRATSRRGPPVTACLPCRAGLGLSVTGRGAHAPAGQQRCYTRGQQQTMR